MAFDPPRRQSHVTSGSSHAGFPRQGRASLFAQDRRTREAVKIALNFGKPIGEREDLWSILSALQGTRSRSERERHRCPSPLARRFCIGTAGTARSKDD